MNTQTIQNHSNHQTSGEALPCPWCGKDQKAVAQWRYCYHCEPQDGWDDAPPETMRAWTRKGVWPAPVAGEA